MTLNSQGILEHLPEAVLVLDKDGYILYSNRLATALTGYDEAELRNRHLSLLYHLANDTTKSEFELAQARKEGQYLAEGWKTRQDGTKLWAELRISMQADEQGTLSGYICTLVDTTEKKQREFELRQSEERYRLMVEGVRDYAIFMLDETGHIRTWNEGAQRLKGYSANEIIGRHFSTFYTADDLEDGKPERELRIAIQTGKYEEEGWRVRKNGSLFWANVVITALFNEANRHIGFSKVTRDLSERKEAEEALRQSEERYRSLVEQVTDYGIFMLDEKGRIISWNEGARRIQGYEPNEIIGKYFSIFYPEEDILLGKPAHELKVARETGKYEEEGWRLRKDGALFWASIVITAVYSAEGILIGFSKVTRDLTERKESEKALRDSHDRYRQLAGELRKANSELSYANNELEQFTSIVSHDLQEPIRTIQSFLMLIDMKLNEHQAADLKTYITKTIGAASRMKELIQNLLRYAQLSQGELSQEEIVVTDLIGEALQNVSTLADTSNARITVSSEVDTVRGDRVQLVQLLQNLLSNALKFTEDAHPRIRVRCWREGSEVRFSVADNGIGIETGNRQKIFEIFRRLHPDHTYPGTGIGLAICKKIVDRHGGRIWPESAPGKGTTFHFTIQEEQQLQPAS